MQFGKSLLGGIIGAAVGVALLFAIYRFSDGFWSAIPFAILTGLGVRMAVSTAGHPSYARGALTAILALAAYIGGLSLVAYVTSARANAPIARAAGSDKASQDAGDADNKDAAPPAPAPIAETAPTARTDSHRGPMVGAPQFNAWNFVWLGVAALVAYELGRGSDARATYADPAAKPAPAGMHPDA
jgi:hypothetical protein